MKFDSLSASRSKFWRGIGLAAFISLTGSVAMAQATPGVTLACPTPTSTGVTAKGATAFKAGDTIEYTYDYYDEDGAYTGTYTDKTPVTYGAGKLQVNYQPIQGGQAVVSYQLTDIYGNQYLTEPVLY